MSICAIWIITLDRKVSNAKKLVFTRQYPIVLKRARRAGILPSSPLPSDEEIAKGILDELQVYRTSDEFVKRFDSCQIQKQAPMYSILGGSIWPIVAISKHGLVFACLPFVNVPNAEKRQLSCKEMGPVAIGYSLLQNISDVVGRKVTDDKIQELRDYLFICMPFGTPTEMDPSTVCGIIASKDSYLLPKTKAPAWRPVFHKGKQQISISIQEKVRCIQYDNPERADLCEVYGTVVCKADLEGAPEVSLDVVSTSDPTILENIVFHPCTKLSDTVTPVMTVDDKRIMDEYGVKTIRFCPPLETFQLFHYKSSLNAPPVMAYYKMTDDENCAKISIQLKLWKNVKNNFENLRVIVPFFNRKQIQRIDYSPMTSNCVILDKNTVCWNVGSKLPSKTLQASLEATIHFDRSDKPVVHSDKFCVGLNSYIKISFKITDYTYSGVKIDNRSVSIYPNSKVKTSTDLCVCRLKGSEDQKLLA